MGSLRLVSTIDQRKMKIVLAIFFFQLVLAFGEEKWRHDNRCGPNYPLADGVTPARCRWANCCHGKFGQCGNSRAHCKCDGCIDYRNPTPPGPPVGDCPRTGWEEEYSECPCRRA